MADEYIIFFGLCTETADVKISQHFLDSSKYTLTSHMFQIRSMILLINPV